jgi:hypothetical protein
VLAEIILKTAVNADGFALFSGRLRLAVVFRHCEYFSGQVIFLVWLIIRDGKMGKMLHFDFEGVANFRFLGVVLGWCVCAWGGGGGGEAKIPSLRPMVGAAKARKENRR